MSPEQHSLDGLLARAEACDIPRAKQLIAKIRSLVEHLAEVVERQEEVSAARARVDKLKTQLAKETAALKRLTTAPPAGRTQKAKTSEVPAADVPNETLRDFAKEHGLPCNPMGRVPNEVRLAYLAVHGKAKP